MTETELAEARRLMAAFFKQRRETLNITQTELAEKTGMGVNTIIRFENGMFWPSLKQYFIICEALQIVPSVKPFEQPEKFIDAMRKQHTPK